MHDQPVALWDSPQPSKAELKRLQVLARQSKRQHLDDDPHSTAGMQYVPLGMRYPSSRFAD